MPRRHCGLLLWALAAPVAAFSMHTPLEHAHTARVGSSSARLLDCTTARRCARLQRSAGVVAKQQTADEVAKQQIADESANPDTKDDEEGWTLQKVANLGVAGVLSIAVAETVFWVLSFPFSELVYYIATGEWINLLEQEGQLKFLAFTAGWGALGGVLAQYRTVLTAAAMTPWMDRNVVQPYLGPVLSRIRNKD